VSLTGQNEISIRIGKRTYQLQAASYDLASEWIDAINAWVSHLSSDD
jgi:hypothetical protein